MRVKFVDGMVYMYADKGRAITDGVHAVQMYCVDPKKDYPKDMTVEWEEISIGEALMDTDLRTIKITVQTDSEEPLEELRRDLQQEINCCTASFDVDNMVVEEKVR